MLTIIIVVAVFLEALLLYAATKPGSCQFSRSIHISAPPERIFLLIDNLRVMNEWNPFVKADHLPPRHRDFHRQNERKPADANG